LAGFFDSEGGVSAVLSKNQRMKSGYRLRLKAYVDQKDELVVLNHIAKLLNVS
jgi:hypothetical protein